MLIELAKLISIIQSQMIVYEEAKKGRQFPFFLIVFLYQNPLHNLSIIKGLFSNAKFSCVMDDGVI